MKFARTLVLFLLVTTSNSLSFNSNTPSPRQVKTKYGVIRGILISLSPSSSTSSPTGSLLKPVEAFLGVPYATAPTGRLRFMPPMTLHYWRDVRLTNRFGPVCPQRVPNVGNTTEALQRITMSRLNYLRRLVPFLRNQSEDCLYLNIYAPFRESSNFSGKPRSWFILEHSHLINNAQSFLFCFCFGISSFYVATNASIINKIIPAKNLRYCDHYCMWKKYVCSNFAIYFYVSKKKFDEAQLLLWLGHEITCWDLPT